jgi:dihydrodipicolinate synthase/N-acetylneuraminate lyase
MPESNGYIGSPHHFLCGVITPMLTPVHSDLSMDYAGAQSMVNWLATRGCVRTVFVRSGMGRMFSFTVEETKRLAEAVHEANQGRMGLLIGAAGEWLDQKSGTRPDSERYIAQAVELTQFAQMLGADGVVHAIPQALTPRQQETIEEMLFRYYQTVHDASELPIVLYQPGGLAPEYRMTPILLKKLLALPRIAGMKVSTTEDAVFSPLAQVVQGTSFALICGHEGYYLKGLKQGAVGVIGQGCIGYPEVLYAVKRYFDCGDLAAAERAQSDVHRGLEATRGLNGAVIIKQYLIRQGVCIEPFDRNGQEPYPEEIVRRFSEAIDALRSPYLLYSSASR